MAVTSFDDLVNILTSYKAVFWQENASLPEIEIRQLWQLQWNYLTFRVNGVSERHSSVIPSKRSIPRTLSGNDYPSSKRQELVGPPYPYHPVLGLTGFPEPVISSP
jgi:hypothetical protein